jgi:AcrR family transcriptional regulator
MSRTLVPPPAGRRQRKRAETRERIFRAAMQRFAQRGFFETTVEDITDAADVGKGTFFNYFPSKEGVFNVLSEIQLGKVAELRTAAESGKATVRDLLHGFFHRIAEEPGRSRELTRSLLAAHTSQGVRKITTGMMARGREHLAAIFALAQSRGEVRRELKPADLAFIFQQTVFGTLMLWSMQKEGALAPWLNRSFEHFWSAAGASKGPSR